MAKSLDGIKKLNPEDIKKYRKMVLNYIGEEDLAEVNEQKNSTKGAASSKKVDSINLNQISNAGRQRKIASKELSAQAKIKQEEIKKQERELAEKKRRDQAEAVRQEELKKQEIIKQAKRQAEKTRQAEEAKQWAEKIKLAELEKAEKKKIKENLRLEKIKRQEEIAKIKLENKIAKQAAREKKKIKRQKTWRKAKRGFSLKLNNFFSRIRQDVIYIIAFLILVLAIAYLIFCLAVLRFKIDNNLISQAIRYLPVPAVITSQGLISYLDYKKIEDNNYFSLSLAEKKNYLAKWLILRGLKEKYGLSADASTDDLAIKYVLDKDFNQSGLSRINKINELLNSQNAVEQLGRYADEYNEGVYYDAKSAAEKFGPKVLELAIGQTSGIIPRADGYYIVKRIDDKDNQFGIKYLFIRARTLDQYLSGKLAKIKVFILAD